MKKPAFLDLGDRALDGDLVALLLEQARTVHQLALVDLALGRARVEQRERRQHVVADASLRRCLRRRFAVHQRQWRRGERHLRRGAGRSDWPGWN